nr:hypothetical protein [Actinomadura sp. CNU-125]
MISRPPGIRRKFSRVPRRNTSNHPAVCRTGTSIRSCRSVSATPSQYSSRSGWSVQSRQNGNISDTPGMSRTGVVRRASSGSASTPSSVANPSPGGRPPAMPCMTPSSPCREPQWNADPTANAPPWYFSPS